MFVGSGTQDLGTGTYTIMAQQAAAGLGIDPKMVEVELGDSRLPKAPVSGGSQSSASVLPAIQDATTQLKLKLADLAISDAGFSAAWTKDARYRSERRKAYQQEQPFADR